VAEKDGDDPGYPSPHGSFLYGGKYGGGYDSGDRGNAGELGTV
jgi:hypothetical protein